jgi:hypothetical protein
VTYMDLNDPRLDALSGYAPTDNRPAERLPLFPPLAAPDPYPVDYLGPVLSKAAKAIASKVQVPHATAAQSVLAVASLAAQAHADVVTPFGQTRPLSLAFVTVAGTGDRKTSSDKEGLWPVRKREGRLFDAYQAERQEYAIRAAAWDAEHLKIKSDRKLDLMQRTEALRDLGPQPNPPLHPLLVAADPTIEGLFKMWPNAPASLGLFSAEGGQFVGGHGMSQENRLRTAAGLSECWDGSEIKRVRAGDGVSVLFGRRLAMHLMIQPEAAALFLGDPVLKDQGLLSRFLVAAPGTLAGSRKYAEPKAEDDAAIKAYGARILSLLEKEWPLSLERSKGLEPRALPMAPAAAKVWKAFYDQVEVKCGAGREYAGIVGLAAKAAEHTARLAGIMAIVHDIDAPEIRDIEMEDAIGVINWYLKEAVRLHDGRKTDPDLIKAETLRTWLLHQPSEDTPFRDILQLGPNATRTKKEAEAALAILNAHGWITQVSSRPRLIRVHGWQAGHA